MLATVVAERPYAQPDPEMRHVGARDRRIRQGEGGRDLPGPERELGEREVEGEETAEGPGIAGESTAVGGRDPRHQGDLAPGADPRRIDEVDLDGHGPSMMRVSSSARHYGKP